MWVPDSQEKIDFVKNTIMAPLSGSYKFTLFLGPTYYRVWIGVHDKPNGNCVLPDFKAKCPIEAYQGGEPNGGDEECAIYGNNLKWNDFKCNDNFHGLCERAVQIY